MKNKPMPENARTVKAYLLRFGEDTSAGIKRALDINHESLFRALIWLEARRIATMNSRQSNHNTRRTVYWSVQ